MTVLDHVNDTLASARHQADRLVPPQTRQRAYDGVRSFAHQRPLLFSFLLAQTLLALLPLALFASFAAGVVAVAAAAGLLFVLFWVGLAALALAAALSATFGLAVLAWAWGAGAYLLVSLACGVVLSGGGRQEAVVPPPGERGEGEGEGIVKKEAVEDGGVNGNGWHHRASREEEREEEEEEEEGAKTPVGADEGQGRDGADGGL